MLFTAPPKDETPGAFFLILNDVFMDKTYLQITIGAILVNNFVLAKFLGICPFLGTSKKLGTAAGMAGAVVFVMTLASLATASIYNFILVKTFSFGPFKDVNIGFLQDHDIHTGHSRAGAGCRDNYAKNESGAL